MRKPSLLPLLLTPALFAFASAADAVATASSSPSAAAAAPATSASPGITAESMATSPRATPSAASRSTTTSSGTTAPSTNAAGAPGSGANADALDVVGIPNQAAIGPTANPSPFAPGSSFSTDNGNPELGTSPGQTSPGTAVGNEPNGLDVGTATLDANGNFNGVPAGALGAGAVAPVDVIGGVGGSVGGGYAAPAYSGGNTTIVAPGRTLANGGTATPLLDQATRNAEQRIARERATGRTPRVIGIAPRTDADRTDQMPDDPIIRY
jgi:hypothetical protein